MVYILSTHYLTLQLNATKAITPATVQVLQHAFIHSHENVQVARSILSCETAMIHALLDARRDQVISFNANLSNYNLPFNSISMTVYALFFL